MRRRCFFGLAGGAIMAVPAQAQQLPAIGYLTLRTPDGDSTMQAAFMRGLAEAGFEENRNIAIAFASAYGQVERLKTLAAELVNRRVAVIFAASSNAALAAKAATATIPIVYTGASDPVRLGKHLPSVIVEPHQPARLHEWPCQHRVGQYVRRFVGRDECWPI